MKKKDSMMSQCKFKVIKQTNVYLINVNLYSKTTFLKSLKENTYQFHNVCCSHRGNEGNRTGDKQRLFQDDLTFCLI